jgi:hypothetical protein
VVAAGVAAQQHPLAVGLGEHDDAREVEHRAVGVLGCLDRGGVVRQPLLPLRVELVERSGIGRHHGQRGGAERHLARRDHEPAEGLVARPAEPDRLVAQRAALVDARPA